MTLEEQLREVCTELGGPPWSATSARVTYVEISEILRIVRERDERVLSALEALRITYSYANLRDDDLRAAVAAVKEAMR